MDGVQTAAGMVRQRAKISESPVISWCWYKTRVDAPQVVGGRANPHSRARSPGHDTMAKLVWLFLGVA
jgi:hypothetical protein